MEHSEAGIMASFAAMDRITFDYEDNSIKLATTFEQLAHLDTSSLEGYMILACNRGQLSVHVNGTPQHLETFEALILPPHTRLSQHMGSPGVRCDLAIIATEVVKRLLGPHIEEWDRCLYIHKTNHIVTQEEEREQFAGYVGTLSFKLQQKESRYKREVIESLLRGILFDYLELMTSSMPELDLSTTEGQQKLLFRRFLELLATRHVKHQLIETYAQELFVSSNYLTRVCRKISGKTAMQWVREYTEADIRYYLLNTDQSITEICDDLGFPNLSFFGKYCRRAFGMSPTDFRRKMGASPKAETQQRRSKPQGR